MKEISEASGVVKCERKSWRFPLLWLALQLPLAILVGRFISFGMAQSNRSTKRAPAPAYFRDI